MRLGRFSRIIKPTIVLLAGALVLSSCVTREDIRGLQTDLYNIKQGIDTRIGGVKEQTDTVQTSQADLLLEIKNLSSSLGALQAELQETREQNKALSLRLDDLQSALTARMDAQIELLSGSKFVEKPLPSTVFNLANSDYSRGKDEEALKGFESYLKQFPRGEQAPEAKLKIGDIQARQGQASAAVETYDSIIRDYPKNSLAPAALLRKGKVYESLGKPAIALRVYDVLTKTYPYTAEARSAQQSVGELQSKTNQ